MKQIRRAVPNFDAQIVFEEKRLFIDEYNNVWVVPIFNRPHTIKLCHMQALKHGSRSTFAGECQAVLIPNDRRNVSLNASLYNASFHVPYNAVTLSAYALLFPMFKIDQRILDIVNAIREEHNI